MKAIRHLASGDFWLAALAGEASLGSRRLAHLVRCSRCRSTMEGFQALHRRLADATAEPPEHLVIRASALMAPRVPRKSEFNRFELARLVLDTAIERAPSVVRASRTARHQIWRSEGADIDIRIEGRALGLEPMLIGQLLPRARTSENLGGNAWLVDGGRKARWTPIASTGEFSLPAPGTRRWTVILEWDGVQVRLKTT